LNLDTKRTIGGQSVEDVSKTEENIVNEVKQSKQHGPKFHHCSQQGAIGSSIPTEQVINGKKSV
jgi:hypothetical protein